MEKAKYESPEFRFQKLFLFEGVADTCWGHHEADLYVYYDRDRDENLDSDETLIYHKYFRPSGNNPPCNSVRNMIVNAFGDIENAFIEKNLHRLWNEGVKATITSAENAHEKKEGYIPVHS